MSAVLSKETTAEAAVALVTTKTESYLHRGLMSAFAILRTHKRDTRGNLSNNVDILVVVF